MSDRPVVKFQAPILSLNGIDYHLFPCERAPIIDSINLKVGLDWQDPASDDFLPLLVIVSDKSLTENEPTADHFLAELAKDDVCSDTFKKHVVVIGHDCLETVRLVQAWSPDTRVIGIESKDAVGFPSGPYMLGQAKLWQPWRSYIDCNATFTMSFRPQKHPGGPLAMLEASALGNTPKAIVPSRSYFHKTPSKPLNGMRIVVKDMYDLLDHKTTLGSRAWTELYPEATSTAPALQRLIDAGAIVVAKTKLYALLSREEPMECVEYITPFNPRGDGYLTASGSSSGGCAALAAYDWIDMAIGSDTNGSCRRPAHWNGCHAIRPSAGVLDTKGITAFCDVFDMPAFFGRDLAEFHDFASAWYGASSKLDATSSKMPKRIWTLPNHSNSITSSSHQKLVSAFVDALVQVTSAQTETLHISSAFGTPAFNQSGSRLFNFDVAKRMKTFREDYERTMGKSPFMQKGLLWTCDAVKDMTESDRQHCFDALQAYRRYLVEEVMEDSLLVFPLEGSVPKYRDDAPSAFSMLPDTDDPLYISPVAGTPEVTVTIGEIPYLSRITNRTEPMPVSVSVVSKPGTDLMLIDLVTKAVQSMRGDKCAHLVTGRSIFGGNAYEALG